VKKYATQVVAKRGKVKKPVKDEKHDRDQGAKCITSDPFSTWQYVIQRQAHAPAYPDEIIRDEKVKQARREKKKADTNDENVAADAWINPPPPRHGKLLLFIMTS
jgi:hypothetical protein